MSTGNEWCSVCINFSASLFSRLRLGDNVTVIPFPDIKYAESITILPFEDTLEGISGDIFDSFVKPYFHDKYRPMHVGDMFVSRGAMRAVEFKVMEINQEATLESDATKEASPADTLYKNFGIVGPNTDIYYSGVALNRQEEDSQFSEVGYEDIGGMSKQVESIRELVELPLRHPQLFRTIGIPPPKGVLLHGPPGSGKTMVAKAIAAETGVYCVLINGPEIMSKLAGESEANLRKVCCQTHCFTIQL